VLDEFAIFPVARGCIALAFDVFGAVPVDLAQLVEQRVMPWPDWIQLIDAPRGRFEQPLSRALLLLGVRRPCRGEAPG
jgi:hypothetical protein